MSAPRPPARSDDGRITGPVIAYAEIDLPREEVYPTDSATRGVVLPDEWYGWTPISVEKQIMLDAPEYDGLVRLAIWFRLG
jgi:hypothetical protein